ncbi:glycosyltransferase family 32 protein [Flavobacterium sp. PS2]|uniref:glycosyltransferase family 32 protein n=1 Tax=Flavobacterium sp. PS2 TaxID=3384157 RepID=UPI00390C4963
MNFEQNSKEDPLSKSERDRSNFIKEFVQGYKEPNQIIKIYDTEIPKQIVHFWDDLTQLPPDVKECMESWRILEKSGFSLQIFDENSAREFINTHLGPRFVQAFNNCYHPSMKSDYFRYSYIFVKGGFYIDSDDVYHGKSIDYLFKDGRLKLQPFCYDIETAQMISSSNFVKSGANKWGWIFYFNTTPLIAARNHPIVERVLLNATLALEQDQKELPEVQATTGPGILTTSIQEIISEEKHPERTMLVLHDWENISTSKWHLSYRNDKRNWRLSNQQIYKTSKSTDE